MRASKTMVVFNGVIADAGRDHGEDRRQERHHCRARRRLPTRTASPAGRCPSDRRRRVRRRAGRRRPAALHAGRVTGDDLLFLQYTGGTTGLSKGAALSHRNLVANTEQFKAFMPDALRPGEEVIVTALPLYHIFALMVNFITYFSVGADNWLVANPRDIDGFIEIFKKRAAPHLHRRQHAVCRTGCNTPKSRRWTGRTCAWRSAAARRWCRRRLRAWKALTGTLHPRGLRPVGDQPGADVQSADHARSSPARRACRCRRPTSSCSTTTDGRSPSASPARSAPRARR